jgi:hypothetical protein
MTIKVVEYVHEYDEPVTNWKTQELEYISSNRETYHAVGTKDTWNSTNEKGEWAKPDDSFTFRVNDTDLHVCNREEALGYIGLFTKLLDEFPED